jgi:hypothetical protein
VISSSISTSSSLFSSSELLSESNRLNLVLEGDEFLMPPMTNGGDQILVFLGGDALTDLKATGTGYEQGGGGGDLQSSLPLETDILWLTDETAQITLGLDALTNLKATGTGYEQGVLDALDLGLLDKLTNLVIRQIFKLKLQGNNFFFI